MLRSKLLNFPFEGILLEGARKLGLFLASVNNMQFKLENFNLFNFILFCMEENLLLSNNLSMVKIKVLWNFFVCDFPTCLSSKNMHSSVHLNAWSWDQWESRGKLYSHIDFKLALANQPFSAILVSCLLTLDSEASISSTSVTWLYNLANTRCMIKKRR